MSAERADAYVQLRKLQADDLGAARRRIQLARGHLERCTQVLREFGAQRPVSLCLFRHY